MSRKSKMKSHQIPLTKHRTRLTVRGYDVVEAIERDHPEVKGTQAAVDHGLVGYAARGAEIQRLENDRNLLEKDRDDYRRRFEDMRGLRDAADRDKAILQKQATDRQGLADDRRVELDKLVIENDTLKREKVQLEAAIEGTKALLWEQYPAPEGWERESLSLEDHVGLVLEALTQAGGRAEVAENDKEALEVEAEAAHGRMDAAGIHASERMEERVQWLVRDRDAAVREKVKLESDLAASAELADETERALRQEKEVAEQRNTDLLARCEVAEGKLTEYLADQAKTNRSEFRRGRWVGLLLGVALGGVAVLLATALWG